MPYQNHKMGRRYGHHSGHFLYTSVCVACIEWSNKDHLNYEVKANQTACSHLKQFDLSNNMILSVCHRDREISVDIRLFLNQTATIRGIPLNLRQWNVLQRVSSSVNSAIEDAKDL